MKKKKAFEILPKLNLLDFVCFNIFKTYDGWFFPFRGGYYNIHRKAKIIINKKASFSFNRGGKNDPFKGYFVMEEDSKLIVNGHFSINSGGRVSICKGATLEVGSGFINHNTFLVCRKRISIGNGATISNNVVIRDNDAHKIIDENYISMKPIEIGNHVWIGTNSTILKGVKINDGVVVGANSLVNKNIPAKCLVAGIPMRIIKENIEWE